MSKRTFAPDETWPKHQKPFWRHALEAARDAGWTLTYLDAPHRFGVVHCPSREHNFFVDKTARGDETKSKEAIKLIRACRHHPAGTASSAPQRQEEDCGHLLDAADRLIELADVGLTTAEMSRATWEELEQLEIQLQTARENVAEILQSEQDALWETALEADDGLGLEKIAFTLVDATATVERGEFTAAALNAETPELAKPLLGRVHGAKRRIAALWRRLEALQEPS